MSEYCVMCPNKASDDYALCFTCKKLADSGWPIVHEGVIQAGDYYEGCMGSLGMGRQIGLGSSGFTTWGMTATHQGRYTSTTNTVSEHTSGRGATKQVRSFAARGNHQR